MCEEPFVFLLLIIIVYLLFRMSCRGNTPKYMLSSLLSRSARSAATSTPPEPDKYVENPGKAINLTPCGATDGSCNDYPKAGEEPKKKNDESLRKFILAHPKSFVFFYAPWCPHCSAAMPGFIEAAAKVDCPCAIVNAELLPRSSISGADPAVKVEHFPFLVKIDNHGKSKTVLDDVRESAIVTAASKEVEKDVAKSEEALTSYFM